MDTLHKGDDDYDYDDDDDMDLQQAAEGVGWKHVIHERNELCVLVNKL
jgi:hypothetical protein